LKNLATGNERPAVTRSQAEERFLALIRTAELPSPDVNVPLHGFEVDFLWREQRLVVEIDGYAYHSDRQAFERDRSRDATLAAHGYRVIRVT
jgi:very-short-patch-repair endonuclease